MSSNHIGDFNYGNFFKEVYPDGEKGAKELLKDSKHLIKYIFKNDSDLGDKVLDNIYVIAGGDTAKQLKLLNTLMIMLSPIIVECGKERYMDHEELEISFPLRNMAMNIIDMVLDMSAKRILEMKETIDNLADALAISTKENSNDKG